MKYEPHFHGSPRLVVVGENNTIITFATGEQRQVPFLAPPKPPHEFVGRREVLRELKQSIIFGGAHALAALNGIPGVGKTATALMLAHDQDVIGHFYDGVLWCGLGREGDPLTALGRWAIALGVSPQDIAIANTLESRANLVHAAIGLRRVLLVADDVWDVRTALAFRLGGPHSAQLITTRFPHIADEFAGTNARNIEELDDAQSLLLLRDFVPTLVENRRNVALSIVQAVRGLPLALVLLGAHLRGQARSGDERLEIALKSILDPEVRLVLEQPQAPVGEHPSLPSGAQLSLRAVIGITFDALSESERQAICALAVFPAKPNTFSHSAAEFVLSGVDVSTLVDSGLLEVSGHKRYTLHQTIVEYLVSHGLEHVERERFVDFYFDFVKKHFHNYALLDAEFQNILASIDCARTLQLWPHYLILVCMFCEFLDKRGLYALALDLLDAASKVTASGTNDDRLRIAHRLGQTLFRQGQFVKANEVFVKALQESSELSSQMRGALLDELGWVQEKTGDYTRSGESLRSALDSALQAGDEDRQIAVLTHLGFLAISTGDYASSESHLSEASRMAERKGDNDLLSGALTHLGWALIKLGRFAEALDVLNRAYTSAAEINFRERMAAVRLNQGVAAEKLGDYERAEIFARQALTISTEIQHQEKLSAAYTNLGLLAEYRGEYDVAEQLYLSGLLVARATAHKERISNLLQNLGSVAEYTGRFAEARNYNNEALALARGIGHQERICAILQERGSIEIHAGNLDDAQRFLVEALQVALEIGHRERKAAVLRHLSEIALARGDSDTAAMQIDESVRIAGELDHAWQRSSSLNIRGSIQLHMRNTSGAKESFQESLRIANKIGAKCAMADALFGLARCWRLMGESKLARDVAVQSFNQFEAIRHYRTKAVSDWIAKLGAEEQIES